MVNETEKKISVKTGFSEKLLPVLLVITIGLSFLVGMLWQKVDFMSKGTSVPGSKNVDPTPYPKLSKSDVKKVPLVSENDHYRGAKEAKVYVIEYSDLECPFCKSFHPTVKQILEDYKGQVAWVYRHFPLDLLHHKARNESEAAECVFALGGEDKFWQFIDKVFEVTPSNNGLDPLELPKIAAEVGVDTKEFNSCLKTGRFKDLVEKSVKSGEEAGVNGTPGVYVVNSKGDIWVVPGAVSLRAIKPTIDLALKN